MRLLLDTQVVLWQLGGERSLSTQATEAIAAADDLLFSAVSYAEIGIKAAVGKLKSLAVVTADARFTECGVMVVPAA